jgi:ABC-type nickel/cobalt efflux system permease component RcnA
MTRAGFASAARFAGLVAGPVLWAINMQAGQILPYSDCTTHLRFSAWLSICLAVLAFGSALMSWRARIYSSHGEAAERPHRFLAILGGLVGLVFGFALVLQSAAGIVLTGCER